MTKAIPFEILASYCHQEAGKSKCQTEGDIAGVGKQEIKHMLKDITNQMGKSWRTNSWILKRRICRVNGNTERGGQTDSFEKEERRNTKCIVKNDR